MNAARSHLEPLPDDVTSAGGVWAVGMVRDEADIISTTVTNLLAQGVERVVIADNLSTDGTKSMLEALAQTLPVTVLVDSLEAYYQSQKMTLLARAAAGAGASWVIPFDADEIWLGPGNVTVAQWLAQCDADVVQVPTFNHVPTDHDDATEPDPVRRLRWRKTKPNRLHKVAFRSHPRARLAMGNHGVSRAGRRMEGLQIRHFPYRSEDQFVRKLLQGGAALAATDLDANVGKVWRGLGATNEEQLKVTWRSLIETENLPYEWWVPRHGLVEDPVDVTNFTLP